MSKRILFLLRQSPYGSTHALEAAESALVAGVFEQAVSVLFRDDGVWQLLKEQDGSRLGVRTLGKVLSALPEYDVCDLYVCSNSLVRRNLTAGDLVLPVTILDSAGQRELLARQEVVVND